MKNLLKCYGWAGLAFVVLTGLIKLGATYLLFARFLLLFMALTSVATALYVIFYHDDRKG